MLVWLMRYFLVNLKCYEHKLIGTVRMCKAVLPHMGKKVGLIINFSSIMGLLAILLQCAYSASKFVEGFQGLSLKPIE